MKYFGYLLVALGIVLTIALFLTNSGTPEGQVIAHYWYVIVVCALLVVGGGVMTLKEK